MAQAQTFQANDVGTTGVTYVLETIGPDEAKEYLAKNKDNRKLSASWVRTLSLRQKRGEWQFTGDPIRFDSNDYLRDGQHRLNMVVETGEPIKAIVIRGLDPKVFMVLDTGKKRDLDTVLDILDYRHSGPLAGVVKDVWAYLADQTPAGVSHEMFVAFLKEHPAIVNSVAFYQDRKSHQNVNLVGYSKALTVAHYLLCQIDRDKGEDFVTRLIYGRDSAGALLTLRNTLIKWSRPGPNKKKATEATALYAIIQVWNAVESGRETKAQIRIPSVDKLKSPRTITPRGFPKSMFIKPSRQLSLIEMLQSDESEEEDTVEEAFSG